MPAPTADLTSRRSGFSLVLTALTLSLTVSGCTPEKPPGWTLLESHPHDPGAYTQGLVLHDGVFLESTGQYGLSQLRRVDPATGQVLARVVLPAQRFGEGLALLGDRLYQLTWKSQVGYVYDLTSFALVDSFAYHGQGWGLTTDGTDLIMSNGSATLRFLDPVTFAIRREVEVRDGQSPLVNLNELEYVDGEIFANVYQSSWIVRIDPDSGAVRQWLDFASLVPKDKRGSTEDVLNGMAYDPATGTLYVTGKRWPRMYSIRVDTLAR